MPAFSLLSAPLDLTIQLRRPDNAPLPLAISEPAASVVCLAPLHFPRKIPRLVSYYALFKGMAASKPTS